MRGVSERSLWGLTRDFFFFFLNEEVFFKTTKKETVLFLILVLYMLGHFHVFGSFVAPLFVF